MQITNSKLEYLLEYFFLGFFVAVSGKKISHAHAHDFPSCGPSISQSGTNKLDKKKINPHETEQKITNDKRLLKK